MQITQEDRYVTAHKPTAPKPLYTTLAATARGVVMRQGGRKALAVAFRHTSSEPWTALSNALEAERETVEELNQAKGLEAQS